MTSILFVAAAGSVGAVLRYLLHSGIQSLSPGSFPLATLVVNTLGCLAIGFLAVTFAESTSLTHEQRLALFVGLLGGFTTFSTFGLETFALLEGGGLGAAALNVALANTLGIAGVWAGSRIAS
jgi:CrcB protein